MVLVGCSAGPALDAPGPVMIGSTVGGNVFLKECVDSIDEHGQSCTTTYYPIDSVQVADPSVFEVTHVEGAKGFRYTALAPGTTTVTVVSEGETYERTLVAAQANQVHALVCVHAYGTDVEFAVDYQIYVDGIWLFHDVDVNPFATTFLLPAPRDSTDYSKVRFRTPATAGMGTITSPFDPSFSRTVRVIDASAVTDISIGDIGYSQDAAVPLGGQIQVRGTSLTAPPSYSVCDERFARTARTLTPTTCVIWRDMQNHTMLALEGPEGFELRGLAAGSCTVEVTLDGTTTTGRRTFMVAP